MSDFINVDSFQPLRRQVQAIKQQRKCAPSERQQYLQHTPPALLIPNDERDDVFYIGGHFVPVNKMVGSIFTLGISRCGKTLQLKPSIATAIASLRPGTNRRVIITDAKQDMLPFVHQITKKLGIPLYYFNLSDARSIAYDIARDLGGRSDKFREATKDLIPTPPHGEAFWTQAAQTLCHAGMLSCQKLYGFNWGLPELYQMTLMDLPTFIKFLSVHAVGKQIAAKYLPEDTGSNTQFGFISQLAASLNEIELAACAQYYTPRSRWLSIEQFLSHRGVLLIGTSSDVRQATNPIVQLIFRTLANKINLLPDLATRKIFIFLDELPFWGKFAKLEELLTFSPSKGAITSLVCQDIQHLINIYGSNLAMTIAGMCQTKLLFAPASTQSAQWAISTLGKRKFRDFRYSTSFSGGGISETENTVIEYDYPISDGELRDLGLANKRTGSRFILSSPWYQPFIKHMTGAEIAKWQPKDSTIPLTVPRPSSHYHMPVGRGDRRDALSFMSQTMSSQQIYEEFLRGFSPGSMEQTVAKHMFHMMHEVMSTCASNLLEFYANHHSR